MKEVLENEYKKIKKILDADEELKTIVYLGIGALSIYLLAKYFKDVTNVVKGLIILNTSRN